MKPAFGLKKSDDLGSQRKGVRFRSEKISERIVSGIAIEIRGAERNLCSRARFYRCAGIAINRKVHRNCAFVKQVKRPDIERAAGKIDAARGLRGNFHSNF